MQNAHWKITSPCHEPIENMDVTSNGHFCHSCKKEVINLDGVKPHDIGYKMGDELCGRISNSRAAVMPAGRWSALLIKYFGVVALFFIPLKKGKTQNQVQVRKPDSIPQKRSLSNKRLLGTLRGVDGKPVRTQVSLTDSTGQVIAETQSIANGKYVLDVDTSKIKGDTLTITANDTPYVFRVDTASIVDVPRNTFNICVTSTSGFTSAYGDISGWPMAEEKFLEESRKEEELKKILKPERTETRERNVLQIRKPQLPAQSGNPVPEDNNDNERPSAVIPPVSHINKKRKK